MTTPQPDEQLIFDEEIAEQLDARYRTRDIVHRRDLVYQTLGAQPGDRILDAGCGPGFFVAELAELVGTTGSVIGVDHSPQMLALATRRCSGYHNVTLHEAEVTSLPVLDASVDRALSVQVMEYIPDTRGTGRAVSRGAPRRSGADLGHRLEHSVLAQLRQRSDGAGAAGLGRASRPPDASPDAGRPAPRGRLRPGRDGGPQLRSTQLDTESFAATIIGFIAQFVAGRCGLTDDDVAAWLADQHRLDERDEFFFACIQCYFTARRPQH